MIKYRKFDFAKRLIITFLLTAALSATVSAEIKIGAPFALSGSVAKLVVGMKGGTMLAAKQVNEQGGVLGQPYTLIFEDSACNPDKAVEVVTHLIEEVKVSALIGPVCSGPTIRQARSVSIPAGVVTFSFSAASFLISDLRDNDLVFRTAISDAYKGKVMADYAIDNGITDIAVSFASDAYNTSVAKVFTEAFKARGGKVVINQAHQPDRPSYEREVSALIAGSENLALFAYYGSSGTQLLKDAFATGKVGQVFGSDGLLVQELIDVLGEDALKSTHILNNSVDESRKAFKAWQAFAEETDTPAQGAYVANAYDATFMMALAIQAAGSADRSKISAGLRAISGPEGTPIYPGEFAKAREILAKGGKINYEGAAGPVDFDDKGDVTGFISVNRVREGKWEAQLLRPK